MVAPRAVRLTRGARQLFGRQPVAVATEVRHAGPERVICRQRPSISGGLRHAARHRWRPEDRACHNALHTHSHVIASRLHTHTRTHTHPTLAGGDGGVPVKVSVRRAATDGRGVADESVAAVAGPTHNAVHVTSRLAADGAMKRRVRSTAVHRWGESAAVILSQYCAAVILPQYCTAVILPQYCTAVILPQYCTTLSLVQCCSYTTIILLEYCKALL